MDNDPDLQQAIAASKEAEDMRMIQEAMDRSVLDQGGAPAGAGAGAAPSESDSDDSDDSDDSSVGPPVPQAEALAPIMGENRYGVENLVAKYMFRPPEVLVVRRPIFRDFQKIDASVNKDSIDEDLALPGFMFERDRQDTRYKLRAVVYHIGLYGNAGHYVAATMSEHRTRLINDGYAWEFRDRQGMHDYCKRYHGKNGLPMLDRVEGDGATLGRTATPYLLFYEAYKVGNRFYPGRTTSPRPVHRAALPKGLEMQYLGALGGMKNSGVDCYLVSVLQCMAMFRFPKLSGKENDALHGLYTTFQRLHRSYFLSPEVPVDKEGWPIQNEDVRCARERFVKSHYQPGQGMNDAAEFLTYVCEEVVVHSFGVREVKVNGITQAEMQQYKADLASAAKKPITAYDVLATEELHRQKDTPLIRVELKFVFELWDNEEAGFVKGRIREGGLRTSEAILGVLQGPDTNWREHYGVQSLFSEAKTWFASIGGHKLREDEEDRTLRVDKGYEQEDNPAWYTEWLSVEGALALDGYRPMNEAGLRENASPEQQRQVEQLELDYVFKGFTFKTEFNSDEAVPALMELMNQELQSALWLAERYDTVPGWQYDSDEEFRENMDTPELKAFHVLKRTIAEFVFFYVSVRQGIVDRILDEREEITDDTIPMAYAEFAYRVLAYLDELSQEGLSAMTEWFQHWWDLQKRLGQGDAYLRERTGKDHDDMSPRYKENKKGKLVLAVSGTTAPLHDLEGAVRRYLQEVERRVSEGGI